MRRWTRTVRARRAVAAPVVGPIVAVLLVLGAPDAPPCAAAPAPMFSDASSTALPSIGTLRRSIVDRLVARDFDEAALLLDDFLERVPDDPVMHYNAACAHACLGDPERAEAHLLAAVRAGFHDFSHVRRDPDLAPLRSRPSMRAILAARDAADGILAARRLDEWRGVLDDDAYRLARDEARRIDLLAPLDATALDDVRARIAAHVDALAEWLFETPPDHRVLVVLPYEEDLAALVGRAHVGGRYRHQSRELVAGDAGRALDHELVHALHHAHMDRLGEEHPIWIQEGLATIFEAYERTDDGALRVRPNDRASLARSLVAHDEQLAWRTLFALDASAFHADPARRYAEVRSILSFVAARAGLEAWYRAYVKGYADDPTGAAALESVFAAPLEEIEAAWRFWVLDRAPAPLPARAPALVVSRAAHAIDSAPVRDVAHETSASDAPDEPDAYERARADYERGRYDLAIERFEAIVAAEPRHANARYALALARVRTGDLDGAAQERDALRTLDRSLASLVDQLLRHRASRAPQS